MKTPDFFGMLYRLVHGGRSDADAALDEATRLRAKEHADHKAWLRENAASVTVPEHPAVALLRDIEWIHIENPDATMSLCPMCEAYPDDGHAPDCRLAAILAGSKPGDRALSELLAEAREEGRREERESIIGGMQTMRGHGIGGAEAFRDIEAMIRARGQR